LFAPKRRYTKPQDVMQLQATIAALALLLIRVSALPYDPRSVDEIDLKGHWKMDRDVSAPAVTNDPDGVKGLWFAEPPGTEFPGDL